MSRFGSERPGAFAHLAFPQNPSAATSGLRQFSTDFNLSTPPTYLTTSMVSADAATASFDGFGYRRDCFFRPMGPIGHGGCMAATMRLRLGPMFGPMDDWILWPPEIQKRWPAKAALLAWKRKGIRAWICAFGPGFELPPLCRPFGGPESKLAQKLSTPSPMIASRFNRGKASPTTKGKEVA
ncbi:PREDICTED: uncharacterized protein LOC101310518 isoform 2 [Fragaria vesca subsp. vesca]